MTETWPKHISKEITEKEDDAHFWNGTADWSRNYIGEIGENKPYRLHFGTAQSTVAWIEPASFKGVRIKISKRFPSFGYDGLEAEDYDFAKKLVHEWWQIVFHVMVWKFDIQDHQSEIDDDECINCFALKQLHLPAKNE